MRNLLQWQASNLAVAAAESRLQILLQAANKSTNITSLNAFKDQGSPVPAKNSSRLAAIKEHMQEVGC